MGPRARAATLRLLACLFLVIAMAPIQPAGAAGWVVSTSLEPARYRHAAVTDLQGRIYVIGGALQNETVLKEVWIYDPGDGTWTEGPTLPAPRYSMAAVRGSDGRIYAVGGVGAGILTTVEVFDPAAGEATWKPVAPLPEPRARLAAVATADGHIYAIGGCIDGKTAANSVFQYTISTNTWTQVASMSSRRCFLAATLGPDGKIYAIGGWDGQNALASVEAYDPAANAWTTVAPMVVAARELAAVTGADGRIYATGGANSAGTSIDPASSVQVYDPRGNLWSPFDGLPRGRASHASVSLSDSRIVVIGGRESPSAYHGLVLAYQLPVAPADTAPPVTTVSLDGPAGADGWHTGPVTVTLAGEDDGSGISETRYTLDGGGSQLYSEPVEISAEGEHTLAYYSVDQAGNTEEARTLSIKIDSAPPTIVSLVRDSRGMPATPTAHGWYAGPLSVDFECYDATSLVATCGESQTLGAGSGQSVRGEATDHAGNRGEVAVGPLNVATQPPSITAALEDTGGHPLAANAYGWIDRPVVVRFVCEDPVAPVVACTPSRLLGEGANQQAPGSAENAAGLRQEITVTGLSVDLTPPRIAWSVVDTLEGPVVRFDCQDDVSGIASCTPDQPLSGRSDPVTGTAIDRAGHTASLTLDPLQLDESAPSLTCETPDDGWHAAAVGIHCAASDAGSGLAVAADASFVLWADVPAGTETDQVMTGTHEACDLAGNCATAGPVGPIKIDRRPPEISASLDPASPGDADRYVTVSFSCEDHGSGVAACSEAVTVDRSAGERTLTGTAIDRVGNEASASVTVNGLPVPDDPPPPVEIEIAATLSGPTGASGWYTGPVVVTLTPSLAGAEIAYQLDGGPATAYVGSFTVDGEGEHVVVYGATGAYVAAEQEARFAIDGMTPVVTCADPDDAWHPAEVKIACEASDEGSGLANAADADFVLSTGAGAGIETDQAVTGSRMICDLAGNCAMAGPVTGIKIDTLAPRITARAEPAHPTDADRSVTVTFTCEDLGSGVAVCPDPVTVDRLAGEQTIKRTAVDGVGNQASASITVPGLDVPPVEPVSISAAVVGPAGAGGWYTGPVTIVLTPNRDRVDITYQLDGGPPTRYTGPIVVSDDGEHVVQYGLAGLSIASAATQEVRFGIDSAPPAVACDSPGSGWHRSDVAIHCAAADAGSGLADASDGSFVLWSSVLPDVETDQAATGMHQVCDLAGNCVTAGPITGIRIDTRAPSIMLGAPSGAYILGQRVLADYACSDGGSGIASCAGTAAPGSAIDTRRIGTYSVTVSATDRAGNSATRTVSYSVRYRVVVPYPTLPRGRYAPLSLQLTDAYGRNLSTSRLPLTAVHLAASGQPWYGHTGNLRQRFQFSPGVARGGGYLLPLNTLGLPAGNYTLYFTTGSDPTLHTAEFRVR